MPNKHRHHKRNLQHDLCYRLGCGNICRCFCASQLCHAFFVSRHSQQFQFYVHLDGEAAMRIISAWIDQRGTSAIEFAMTAPAFFLIVFVIIEGGLLLWTQLGLQHGVELAARCATVNTTLCGSASAVQAYAVQQAFGLSVSPSAFTVSTPACGNQVMVSYTYQFISNAFGIPSLTLNAQSCFPK